MTSPSFGTSPERFQHVNRLFDRALEVTAGARPALVTDLCGTDTSLRDEVLALLRVHEGASPGWHRPASQHLRERSDAEGDSGAPKR